MAHSDDGTEDGSEHKKSLHHYCIVVDTKKIHTLKYLKVP